MAASQGRASLVALLLILLPFFLAGCDKNASDAGPLDTEDYDGDSDATGSGADDIGGGPAGSGAGGEAGSSSGTAAEGSSGTAADGSSGAGGSGSSSAGGEGSNGSGGDGSSGAGEDGASGSGGAGSSNGGAGGGDGTVGGGSSGTSTTDSITSYCTDAGCNLTLEYERSPSADAQFLIQASFGPTRASRTELDGLADYADWIQEQMSLQTGSHREYYRERVNGRLIGSVGAAVHRSPCQAGSRWSAFALGSADKGKAILVAGNKVYIDDQFRTDIDPSYSGNHLQAPPGNCTDERNSWMVRNNKQCSDLVWPWGSNCAGGSQTWLEAKLCQQTCYDNGHGYLGDDCSLGWASMEFQGYVCEVEEAIGGWVALSTTSSCENWIGHENPAIWLSSPGGSDSRLSFEELWPGVLMLSEPVDPPCTLGSFVYHDGQHYIHDRRIALARNDLGAPSAGSGESCSTVAKTFLNEASCQIQSACSTIETVSALLTLNTTSFQLFLDVAGKHVYSVTGLRATSSPCGVLSRWQKLDGGAPVATSLSASDEESVVAALQSEEGWLRDVYIPCASVPANAIVAVGGDLFQHSHINEHNVYDFSAWVVRHPGGAGHITRWASEGFQAEFPPDHPMSRWTDGGDGADTQLELGFVGRLGDTVDFLGLPVGLQMRELALAFGAGRWTVGFQTCGSPGEVANDPAAGHHFSFFVDEDEGVTDLDFEHPYRYTHRRFSKSTVWTNLALHTPDQLRQRVAWALSQIFVVSTAGSSISNSNEAWVTYYDIFVRNAFGNYRDIMREVTHSPMMADFLSFRDSKSLDKDGSYPDENYAREIMQLFSIGLWELNPDGTRKEGDGGNAVPTYSNDHIMSFARVFTGFTNQEKRSNIEDNSFRNFIDPMQMRADWHDVYPKPDLKGDYLGDGYPLCSDLPSRAFLLKGARYEFLGYDYSEPDVMVASSDSELYTALLPFRPSVVLDTSLECHGNECHADGLRVIQVADGYYEYRPPTCVHLYFFNGQVIAPGGDEFGWSWKQKCANPDTLVAGISCCDGCTNTPNSWMLDNDYTCEEPHDWMFSSNCRHNEWWSTNKFCRLACWENGAGYGGDNCSRGAFIHERACGYTQEKVRFSTASATCERLGFHVCEQQTPTAFCGLDETFVWTPEVCSVGVEVHADGSVSSQMDGKTMQNKMTVQWRDGHPSPGACPGNCTASVSGCVCPIIVEVQAVFSDIPSKEELRKRLRIGAGAPESDFSCLAACDSDVKAYARGGVVDATTIFECDGAYFKNSESLVDVGGYTFRNPPVFALSESLSGRSDPREALAEVESLLDHLFHHPNTAPFVSHRLIQRLVTSNPTPGYVYDVALAFTQGQFGGVTYSGRYGDLGAAVAAILLHPEARGQRQEAMVGKLREPILKIVHFLRSMEYRGDKDRQDVLLDLQDIIGQFPYETPSVFNFFTAEFQPASFPDGKLAPEFEIFTPPLALGWVNGMLSLLDYGLSECKGGFGIYIKSCYFPEGRITWDPEGEEPAQVLEELSLLLTGGRLSAADAVQAAYEAYPDDGDLLKAALRAIVMSAEFHTLGEPAPAGLQPEQSAQVLREPDSYKAMVLLYLAGGADTFNLLVPLCSDLYAEYVAVREEIALSEGQLNSISAPTQACATFGVHHRLPFVAQLYQEGELAFVSNVGSLVEPTTKEEYEAKTSRSCAGMFSHVDQTNGAQTLECQVQGSSPRGFGGRLADWLAGENYLTTSFSLAGTATWSQGFLTSVEIVSGSSGVVQLEGYEALRAVIGNITRIKYGNVYAEEYVRQFAGAIRSSESLGGYLDQVVLTTSYDTSTGLAKQLMQVSRLIATREARKAERDFFFVQIGGFDTHHDTNGVLDEKFQEINDALEGFVAEMRGQQVFDVVTLVTSSEFGRTLTSNGAGTDHAWAGNHFVLGGSIRGGRIFNDFPESLLEGSDQDAGRGRLIPKYPWESVMVPIAEWFGADPESQEAFSRIFPNLNKFDPAEHIISKSDLFNSYDLV